MKASCLALALLIALATSCISPRIINHADQVRLTAENINKLNGTYSNLSNGRTVHIDSTLWPNIKPFMRDTFAGWREAKVQFTIVPNNRISFKLMHNEKIIREQTLKYKLKSGYLVCTNNYRLEGLPPLFYKEQEMPLTIGLDNAGRLIMDAKGYIMGGVLIFMVGQNITRSYKFERIH